MCTTKVEVGAVWRLEGFQEKMRAGARFVQSRGDDDDGGAKVGLEVGRCPEAIAGWTVEVVIGGVD